MPASAAATKASSSIVRRKCTKMGDLQDYLPSFRLRVKELDAAKTPLPPSIALDVLKAATVRGIRVARLTATGTRWGPGRSRVDPGPPGSVHGIFANAPWGVRGTPRDGKQ